MDRTVYDYNGKWVVCKFRPISSPLRAAYRDDVFVYTYRGQTSISCWRKLSISWVEEAVIDALINVGVSGYIR